MTDFRLLVIGRSGQLARELARSPLPDGWSLQAIGRDEVDLAGPPDALHRALDRHAAGAGRTVVVNAAAYTAVDRAESDAATAFAVNRDGPARLAAACAARGLPLIHISTDYVFDGGKPGPYTEEDAVAPASVYGASKEAGERGVREAAPRHVVLRTAWVYSPFGHNFVKTMLRLGRERAEISIVDDQRGCPTAARDLAQAVVAVAARIALGKTDGFGTFHFAGRGECTWFGFAQAIFAAAERHGYAPPRLRPIATADYPTPARRPANSMLDCSRIGAVYGLEAPHWSVSLNGCVAELMNEERAA